MADPLLQMRTITKHFGGVHALRGVSFSAHAGEVHALCGENGAGKLTLMKILAGAITGHEGSILLNGKDAVFAGPRDAEDAGIRIIYQELNLVPDLSVTANVFLGRELTFGPGLLNHRAMEVRARALFETLGAAIHPRASVGDLRVGDQQMVEIAKALCHGRRSSSWMSRPRPSPTPRSPASSESSPTSRKPGRPSFTYRTR